jgi:hypothetical protein
MEEDLRARLLADAGISALAKRGSIAWGDRPQASALPAITLDYIDDARPQHMQGFQDLRGTQVQADVWADDKKQARDLRELVIAALVPVAIVGATSFQRSFVDRLASSFESIETGIVYRERIDFTIWHAPAA